MIIEDYNIRRKEERIQASVTYNEQHGKLRVIGGSAILSDEEFIAFNKNPDFIAGATWADENPKKGLINIDKAIEWLERNFNMPDDFREHFIKVMEDYPLDDNTLFPIIMKCPKCGKEIWEGTSTCPCCGCDTKKRL